MHMNSKVLNKSLFGFSLTVNNKLLKALGQFLLLYNNLLGNPRSASKVGGESRRKTNRDSFRQMPCFDPLKLFALPILIDNGTVP